MQQNWRSIWEKVLNIPKEPIITKLMRQSRRSRRVREETLIDAFVDVNIITKEVPPKDNILLLINTITIRLKSTD